MLEILKAMTPPYLVKGNFNKIRTAIKTLGALPTGDLTCWDAEEVTSGILDCIARPSHTNIRRITSQHEVLETESHHGRS